MKPFRLVLVVVLAVIGVFLWLRRDVAPADAPRAGLRATERLTIALAGDTLAGPRFLSAAHDDVAAVLHAASLALTDLDQPLRSADNPPPASDRPAWPIGGSALGRALRLLGFTVVTIANEHASDDHGADPVETAAVLDRAGLTSAGGGSDLDHARSAAIVSDEQRRVAILNVATSVPASGRASRRRGDIQGRPGVNTLRYSAVVTADPTTFAALSQMARVLAPDGESATSADSVTLSGTIIKRGATTSVELVVDRDDLSALVNDISAARTQADVVVVSLHTHEPGNRSEMPADFVRGFAHQAIDAGASLVVGHGTRQLRGIELYGGGAIFYGLGSLAFERTAIPEGAGTVFDTDVNAYDLALGAIQRSEALHMPRFDEAAWWESLVATATFDGPTLQSITITPLDLGVERPVVERGLPRTANGARAQEILARLTQLSSAFGTIITIDGDRGQILVARSAAAASR